jgi:multisubunit Na+/H+ antiporter MnhB subunit
MRSAYGDDAVYETRTTRAFHWSPAQVVAGLIGAGYVVLGAVVLARTGFNVHHVTHPVTEVWRWHQTPILGLAEVAFGALMFLAALRPATAKAFLAILSLVALGLGITVLVGAFTYQLEVWFGATRNDAWLYVGTGVLGLLAAMASPTFWHTRRYGAVHRRGGRVPA